MVTVGGRRLRVDVRPGTDPDRPPLLLCNGIGASLELLEPFVDALDPAIEVIRFDAPGVGGSPAPPLPYPFPLLARLVGRLLDALGYRRFDVLGVSWGGGLAQQLALQNPRRCRRLVLVATATGWTMLPAHPRVLLRMATPRRHRDAGYARAVAGDIYGGSLRGRPDLVARPDHRARPAGVRARLPLPARGRRRLDQPAVPAADPAAHADPGRRRRPDHPAGQRPAHGPAAARTPGCTSTPTGTSACSRWPTSWPR